MNSKFYQRIWKEMLIKIEIKKYYKDCLKLNWSWLKLYFLNKSFNVYENSCFNKHCLKISS